ncbi:hypothetical protein [Caldanaerobius polysaccharolyticus]|nr:hypothetical protein [Caldanaerobius polysaccharolyticus]
MPEQQEFWGFEWFFFIIIIVILIVILLRPRRKCEDRELKK